MYRIRFSYVNNNYKLLQYIEILIVDNGYNINPECDEKILHSNSTNLRLVRCNLRM